MAAVAEGRPTSSGNIHNFSQTPRERSFSKQESYGTNHRAQSATHCWVCLAKDRKWRRADILSAPGSYLRNVKIATSIMNSFGFWGDNRRKFYNTGCFTDTNCKQRHDPRLKVPNRSQETTGIQRSFSTVLPPQRSIQEAVHYFCEEPPNA